MTRLLFSFVSFLPLHFSSQKASAMTFKSRWLHRRQRRTASVRGSSSAAMISLRRRLSRWRQTECASRYDPRASQARRSCSRHPPHRAIDCARTFASARRMSLSLCRPQMSQIGKKTSCCSRRKSQRGTGGLLSCLRWDPAAFKTCQRHFVPALTFPTLFCALRLRICDVIRRCSSNEYESMAPTATSNRVCMRISSCSEGEFELSSPTVTTDRYVVVVIV